MEDSDSSSGRSPATSIAIGSPQSAQRSRSGRRCGGRRRCRTHPTRSSRTTTGRRPGPGRRWDGREGVGHPEPAGVRVEDEGVSLVEPAPAGLDVLHAHSRFGGDLGSARRAPELDEEAVGQVAELESGRVHTAILSKAAPAWLLSHLRPLVNVRLVAAHRHMRLARQRRAGGERGRPSRRRAPRAFSYADDGNRLPGGRAREGSRPGEVADEERRKVTRRARTRSHGSQRSRTGRRRHSAFGRPRCRIARTSRALIRETIEQTAARGKAVIVAQLPRMSSHRGRGQSAFSSRPRPPLVSGA